MFIRVRKNIMGSRTFLIITIHSPLAYTCIKEQTNEIQLKRRRLTDASLGLFHVCYVCFSGGK